MSDRTRLCALFAGIALSVIVSLAHADVATDRAYVERLIARQIIAGVATAGDTATIVALAPFAGADGKSMGDVARMVLRLQAADAEADPSRPAVVRVIVRYGGQQIATYTSTTGLVRG